jgi:hypothetical protein
MRSTTSKTLPRITKDKNATALFVDQARSRSVEPSDLKEGRGKTSSAAVVSKVLRFKSKTQKITSQRSQSLTTLSDEKVCLRF